MREFSMKDKIGYTLGDLGCCCTEQFRAMFLTVFYTLVLKVNPLHVGTILLITKIWDAINDPIIGALIDARKSTKGGRFIPWIKAFSIPMAIMCVIGFLDVSSFDYKLKLIYILVTYVLYEALYTCVNVPFGSLSSVMTDDVNHRTDLSRYRSLGGTIFMTVVVIAGPLVLYKDNNPIPSRFTLMALICATIGVFCLMITSSWCKERVSITVEKREKFNYFEALKHIIKNRALLGLIFSSLAGMIAASVVNGLNTYLFKDYFGNVQIMAVSGMLSTVYSIITFVGTKFVSKKFGKKRMVYVRSRFCRYRIRNFILLPDQESNLVHCYQRNLLPRCKWFPGTHLGYGKRCDRLPGTDHRRQKRRYGLCNLFLLPQACFRSKLQLKQLYPGSDRI